MDHSNAVFVSFLSLRDFRNYEQLELPLGKGVSLFFGKNAAGKTNLLEALYYISALTSPRAERDADMARWGQDRFSLAARVEKEGGADFVKVETKLTPTPKRRLTLNDAFVKRWEVHGVLPSVYFSPDDLSIVKRGSNARRKYLDSLLSRIDPVYARDLARYQDAMDRRNAALRRLRYDSSWKKTVDALGDLLVESGASVLSRRLDAMDRLSSFVRETYYFIGGEECSMTYLPSCGPVSGEGRELAVSSAFQTALEGAWPADRDRCVTSVGPHRDDISLEIGGKTVRYFGSQGQQRSVALALRMAEARMLEETFGKKPVLLLDDVFSELDAERRGKVLSLCDFGHQIFVTSTDPVSERAREFATYLVKNGTVTVIGGTGEAPA